MTTIDQRTVQTLPEVVRVPHPDDMDLITFIKHFGARHADSLPEGYALSPERMTPYVEECWRRFHERLHRLRTGPNGGYDHDHKAPVK
jgi:hypothetical protein